MLKQVVEFCQKHRLFLAGDNILLACSGGPDSLCMVHLFIEIADRHNLMLFVAHIEHGIRGEESLADAHFVEQFCRDNNIDCYLRTVDAQTYAQKNKISLEMAARDLRYAQLRALAKELNCQHIAVAHHRKDQAETVLMHMLRGSGSKGLAGMQPSANGIIRPLLNCSREQIEDYCQRYNLVPRIDSTNYETDYTRNDIRWNLLPQLKKFNPNVEAALCRTASLLAEENDFILTYTQKVFRQIAEKMAAGYVLSLPQFSGEHRAVQRQLIRIAIYFVKKNINNINNVHIDDVLILAKKAVTGTQLDLPEGLKAVIQYQKLFIGIDSTLRAEEVSNIYLQIPGRTRINKSLGVIDSEVIYSFENIKAREICYIDAAKITGKLMLRSRQDGDIFYPKGLTGHKKIKKLFIDYKIPRQQRQQIPILCDDKGIVWVVGLQQDRRYLPTQDTEKIIKLVFTKNIE